MNLLRLLIDLDDSETNYSTFSDLDKLVSQGDLLWLQVFICIVCNTWYYIFTYNDQILESYLSIRNN